MPKKKQTKKAPKRTTGRKATAAKPAAPKKANGKGASRERPEVDLTPLKKKAAEARSALDAAAKEATSLRKKAKETEAAAKKTYAKALAPYRDACRKAGVTCEFAGIKAPPVAPRVGFLVERTKGGIKVAVKGRPETERTISDQTLGESIGKAAKAYCEEFLGDVASQGAKFAGLGNRFRAALAGK